MLKKYILYSVLVVLVLVFAIQYCKEPPPPPPPPVCGGITIGGVLRMNMRQDFRSLYPLNITEYVGDRIASQMYEGLVSLSTKDLSIQPALAESWEVNEDATSFTFYLRKGVVFHDYECFEDEKGREVTAQDFAWCFERLCTQDPVNTSFWAFENRVQGANAYYKSTVDGKPLASGVTGIEVIDRYTLRINLVSPQPDFLQILALRATCVYPKEAWDMYGREMRIHCVGTGPFVLSIVKEGEAVILANNENYWRVDEFGNQLPYLSRVKITFLKEKRSEVLEYKKRNLDILFGIPRDFLKELANGSADSNGLPGKVFVTPYLGLTYYGFRHSSDIFSDKRIRQAFNYAIDRDTLMAQIQGFGLPASKGIVPFGIEGYPYEDIDGYSFDPDKARSLLKEAGYPHGKGFPEVDLYLSYGWGNATEFAELVREQLSSILNVKVILYLQHPHDQSPDKVINGEASFWKADWVADYPAPLNFLNLLYGGNAPDSISSHSRLNLMGYKSPVFDSLFEAAGMEMNQEKRYDLYRQADQVAIDDAVILPLYYHQNYWILSDDISNFPINSMGYINLAEAHWK